ncbi:DUF3459 domain-containing protein [Caulobacter sp. 17J80-11]|nr:DUF3459 domain-containing protein [Caulobacter sp. 17J80-11]
MRRRGARRTALTIQLPVSRAGTQSDWWRGAVIYQIYPRSFADSNGDGVGDLPGIIEKLDHVADLGVDGVWLSPFFTSPMKDFGYDIADFRGVDPVFGTLSDFDRLVERAHKLGLKVVIDQVYSHTSDQHAWFQESRSSRTNAKADWYTWADCKPDGTPPSNWQSVFGGPAWTWDARREQYYLHNFLSSQPDLNVHHPEVQEALLDTARFWMDRGVDGFRLDAVSFLMHDPSLRDNPPVDVPLKRTRPFDFQHHLFNKSHGDIPGFLTRLRKVVDGYAGRFIVAEVGGELADGEMKQYTHGPERLHSAYGFNYLYAETLTPQVVRDAIAVWPGAPQEGWPSWAFSNHDAPRHVSRWAQASERERAARVCMLLLLCLRGNIFLYQGEELGLPQAVIPRELLQDPEAIANWPQTLGRDGARTPMPWTAGQAHGGFSQARPWLPVPDEHLPLAVDRQAGDDESMLHLTRRLLDFRRAEPALRLGAVTMLDVAEPLVGFEREHEGRRLVCLFNLGAEAVAVARPDWTVLQSVGGATNAVLPPLSGFVAERA